MRRLIPALCSAFIGLCPLVAQADTYTFTFTGQNVDSFSFSLPSQFHNDNVNELSSLDGNYYNNIPVTIDGVSATRQIGLAIPFNGGGVIFTGLPGFAYGFNGPQLFSGTAYKYTDPVYGYPGSPFVYYNDATLNLGTYTLSETAGPKTGTGTLVISDSSVTAIPTPEPSSLLLIGTGVLGCLCPLRKRFTAR